MAFKNKKQLKKFWRGGASPSQGLGLGRARGIIVGSNVRARTAWTTHKLYGPHGPPRVPERTDRTDYMDRTERTDHMDQFA